MRLGRLNRRVTILRAGTPTRDALNTPVKAWVPFVSFWAEEIQQRPMESWKAGQTAAQTETLFRLRRNPRSEAITAQDRLVSDGRTFEIIGVTARAQGDRIELVAIAAPA